MSYILDALRRANSERERGTVPTLTADPGPADRAQDDEGDGAAPRWQIALWIAGAAATVVVVLAAIWLWPEREASMPVIAAAPSLPPSPPVQQPPRALEDNTEDRQQAAPAVPFPPATVPLSVPPLVEPAPATAAPVTPPKPAATVAESRTPARAELPEDVRKQLPALATSGAMYSDTPANRMVIINGQLLHEGDKVAPDLVLEQIQLKGAVLSFKGQRFTISY